MMEEDLQTQCGSTVPVEGGVSDSGNQLSTPEEEAVPKTAKETKRNKKPDMPLYSPPALRQTDGVVHLNSLKAPSDEKVLTKIKPFEQAKETKRNKKPDMPLYSPPAFRQTDNGLESSNCNEEEAISVSTASFCTDLATRKKEQTKEKPHKHIKKITDILKDMNYIMFVDRDNFNLFPIWRPKLPKKTAVLDFFGGQNKWREPKCATYRYQRAKDRFYRIGPCGTAKDATDDRILEEIKWLHKRLPFKVIFIILSGDKGFLKTEREMRLSKRKVKVIDPHKIQDLNTKIKSLGKTG